MDLARIGIVDLARLYLDSSFSAILLIYIKVLHGSLSRFTRCIYTEICGHN
jgi:hypothetical protein